MSYETINFRRDLTTARRIVREGAADVEDIQRLRSQLAAAKEEISGRLEISRDLECDAVDSALLADAWTYCGFAAEELADGCMDRCVRMVELAGAAFRGYTRSM